MSDELRVRVAAVAGALWGSLEIGVWMALDASDHPAVASFEEAALSALLAWLLSIAIWRRTRLAGPLLALAVLASLAVEVLALGAWWMAFRSMIAFGAVCYGIPAVFRLHQGRALESPLLVGLGFGLGLSSMAAIAGSIFLLSDAPPTRVLTGRQLPAAFAEKIAGAELLEEGEQLLFYYSPSMLHLMDELYILTDRHVIAHGAGWTTPTTRIRIAEITELEEAYSDSWLLPSGIAIRDARSQEIIITLSTEAGGDGRFGSELRRRFVALGGDLGSL